MPRKRFALIVFVGVLFLPLCILYSSQDTEKKSKLGNNKPNVPEKEKATFEVQKGFEMRLVAHEPDVVDPVALAFDEDGRLFVAEMRGYPNEGYGTGNITSGKIRMLEDRDGDGVFEHSTIYADKLRFPTSVMPYRGGLLVANAPDILYLEDTDNDGKADKRRVLYTGFDVNNIQQLLSSFQWGLDNWVYGCAGGKGGRITSAEKRSMPALDLRGRGIRFHPDQPGSLQPMSGGGQFGLAADDMQNWFTATNSQHLRQIVLPDHYLKRNPLLPVRTTTVNIPDHGAACKVFRISPFEAWRVERTGRRKKDPNLSKRLPSTELVPGGYITSGTSPIVYLADLFPAKYYGNVFVCDPANNLIHRDVLEAKSPQFVAHRGDKDHEFLASRDNWFRPVNQTIGPDGAIYLADFYREVIETPRSLPDDIKKQLILESRDRGRIWKIVPKGTKTVVRPRLSKATAAELVNNLNKKNIWWRLTSQRLLVERQDKSAVKPLRRLLHSAKFPPTKAHVLWTLHGLSALGEEDVLTGLRDPSVVVRSQALRLAEEWGTKSPKVVQLVTAQVKDKSPLLRFQLAFTLGEMPAAAGGPALAKLAKTDLNDSWMRTAILSSANDDMAPSLLAALVKDKDFNKAGFSDSAFLKELTALVVANPDQTGKVLALLDTPDETLAPWQFTLLKGIGDGLQRRGSSLSKLWDNPPKALRPSLKKALAAFDRASVIAADGKKPIGNRVEAVKLLAYGPYSLVEKSANQLLDTKNPPQVQLSIVRALSEHNQPGVADTLLSEWKSYSPDLRGEVLRALLAQKSRVQTLLDAIAKKRIHPNQLDTANVNLLRKYPDKAIRQKATKLLSGLVTTKRDKVIKAFASVLDKPGNFAKGKMVFKKNCATCHRLEKIGFETGPDLLAALPSKSREDLLTAILDPNREVDPRYLNYVVETKAGKIITGRIAAETANSITLRRGENMEDVILRTQIATIQATTQSLMPEGLEKQVSQAEMADLLTYLTGVVKK